MTSFPMVRRIALSLSLLGLSVSSAYAEQQSVGLHHLTPKPAAASPTPKKEGPAATNPASPQSDGLAKTVVIDQAYPAAHMSGRRRCPTWRLSSSTTSSAIKKPFGIRSPKEFMLLGSSIDLTGRLCRIWRREVQYHSGVHKAAFLSRFFI